MANTKVQSEQIEDGSITADKLADGTIVAAELADNAVVTAAINADAVTGAKIADNAIDSEHYTDGSIDTAHIADAQITVGKMAANSVDSDQYVDGSIDTVHIADLQVTTAKIANGNISTAKIADNAVTSAKIDTNIDIAGTFDVTGATTLDAGATIVGSGTGAGLYLNGTNSDSIAQGNFVRYGTNFLTQSDAANSNLITYAFNGSTFVNAFNIQSDGKVGIGGSPARTFTVKSAAANSTQISLVDNDSTNEVFAVGQQSDGDGFLTVKQDDGTTKVQFDASGDSFIAGGSLHVGSTDSVSSSAEVFSVYSASTGHSKMVNSSDSYGTLYMHNESTTADTFQPFIIMQKGGGNRGNIGLRHSDSVLGISGQGGISLRTNSTSVQAATEALKIDSSGRITAPYQPAFLVTPATTQSNIAASTNVNIAFGTEIFDQGSNFASNTFTAPVTGKYQLNVNLRLNNVDSAANYYHINLVTSNRVHYSIFDPDFGQDAAYYTIQLSVLADMDANDTASVSIFQSAGTAQTDIHSGIWSTFSGYLVA